MAFNNERCSTHAENQTVSTTVERQSGFFNHIACCGCTRSCKATSNPFPQIFTGHIVSRNDDDSVNSVAVQPVFSYAKSSSGRCTSEVNGRVWTTDSSVLSELGMAHVERLEEISAVKPSFSVIAVALGVLHCHLQPRETGGEHNTRSLPLMLWNLPIANQSKTAFANLFNRRERDRSISQCQQSRSNGQLSRDVPCKNDLGINAKLFCNIKRRLNTCKLRNVAKLLGLFHVNRTVPTLDETNDVLIEQTLLVFIAHF